MLMLICPCSNAVPLPERGARVICRCGRALELKWFRGPDAWQRWNQYLIQSGKLTAMESGEVRIEWRAEAKASGAGG